MPNIYWCNGCGHDNYFHIEDAPNPEAYSCQSCWTKIPFAEAAKLDAAKMTDAELNSMYAEMDGPDAEDLALADAEAYLDRQINADWYAGVSSGDSYFDDEIPF